MRTAELKPNTQYATCNGGLVVPVEPIHANWFYVYNHKTEAWDLIDGGDQARAKQDPWGPCHKPANKGNGALRRTKPGVLMNLYSYDRDGKRVGEPEHVVIDAKDIAGTWKEYMALYADVVRARVDERHRAYERQRAVEEIKECIGRRYGVAPDTVSTYLPHRREGAGYLEVTIRINLPVPRSRAKNPPDPHVRVAEQLKSRW